jgi:hypothetical protein
MGKIPLKMFLPFELGKNADQQSIFSSVLNKEKETIKSACMGSYE